MEYRVSEKEQGLTLLAFLFEKGKGGFSLKKTKKLIESKRCKVGGLVEFFSSRKLVEGEQVEVDFAVTEESVPFSFSIVFQDEFFAVVNKPSGVICTDEIFQKHLTGKKWVLVHRLDKDTSGLVLLAKTSEAEARGKKLFKERDVSKLYLALVDGSISQNRGKIESFLGKKGGYEGQTLYGSISEQQGKKAITHWTLVGSRKEASLLLCDLKTGRTHQIRVHLSEWGHPILGDHQYGRKAFFCSYMPKRHLLHAWKLQFLHPFTTQKIEVIASIPEDFQKTLDVLGIELKT